MSIGIEKYSGDFLFTARNLILVLGAAAFFIAAGHQSAAQSPPNKKPPQEQSIFGMEETPVLKPVPLPEEVLQNIRTSDQLLQACLEYDHIEAPPPSWFLASRIHLDGPNEIDYVIQANGGCLLGANITSFWIYRHAPRGYEPILVIHVHDLEVLREKWKGHRNVRVYSMTVSTITTETFRFDGERYQSYRKITKPIN